MSAHPVQLHVESAPHTERIHVVIRVLLLVAIGTLGLSWLYGFLYLVLPALVALRILNGGSERYLAQDGPRVVRVLRWLASACAYFGLLTDVLPTANGSPVELALTSRGTPTPTSALLRLVTSLPAVVVLALLSVAAGFVWAVAAVLTLIRRRMPGALADFLALVLRYQFRLVAYHLSLVDRYPSFEESRTAHAADSGAVLTRLG
jgi:hypothetical protein